MDFISIFRRAPAPMTYEDLIKFDCKCVNVNFQRAPCVMAAYQRHQARLARLNITASSIILNNMGSKNYLFCANIFPYNTTAKHLIYWMRPGHELSMHAVKQRLAPNQVIVVENSYATKSIKDIPHYHIFMK